MNSIHVGFFTEVEILQMHNKLDKNRFILLHQNSETNKMH